MGKENLIIVQIVKSKEGKSNLHAMINFFGEFNY